MPEWLSLSFVSMSAMFIVVDPIGVVPTFLSVNRGRSPKELEAIAKRACIVSSGILIFFALFGSFIFKMLHLELNAFRVAGGILLLLTALDMLRAKMPEERATSSDGHGCETRADVAIVPLSIPLLAGPGAMTTVVVLMSQGKSAVVGIPVVLSIIFTFIATYFIFRAATRVQSFLGPSGMLVLERVMGLILAAIAVQFLADGGRGLLGF